MMHMAATRAGQNKLRTWEHPAKSGIWISEVQNRSAGESFGVSYKVTIPAKLAGTRQRKQFNTKASAEEFAASEQERLRKQGQDGFSLTPAQRREVATAFEKLIPSGIGLLEAVTFALKHMRPEGGERTVQQVIDEISAVKKARFDLGALRPSSYRDFLTRSARFAELFGSAEAKSVTLDEIKAWLKSLEISARSRKNYRMTVSEIFKYAHKKKYRADNPMHGFTREDKWEVEPGADEYREPAILSVVEAERLLKIAFAHPELDLGAAVALALFCGIRTEELKRLQWAAVRLDDPKPFVKIDRSIAKKRRIRNVEIPACAVAWLRAWPKRDGAVTRNSYITDYVKRFARLTKLAAFGKKDDAGEWVSTWDDNAMRHSFGSYTFALTGDSMKTAGLMGHKANDQVLFDHYRALTTKSDAEAYFGLFPRSEDGVIIRLGAA